MFVTLGEVDVVVVMMEREETTTPRVITCLAQYHEDEAPNRYAEQLFRWLGGMCFRFR